MAPKEGYDVSLSDSSSAEAPPAYEAVVPQGPPSRREPLPPEALTALNSAFASLQLPDTVEELSVDACLAHLKLLAAFEQLKEEVGYTDGLWGIQDSWASEGRLDLKPEPSTSSDASSSSAAANAKNLDQTARPLAAVREKRWALFVARAVDRYEAWWNTFPTNPLEEVQMVSNDSKYGEFTSSDSGLSWTPEMLPPLDVLMVWHAHMLNPRDFLEDCLRNGLNSLWVSGMPWRLVNDAIDSNFNYNPSENGPGVWEAQTGYQWNSIDDASYKAIKCPSCSESLEIPWTTCFAPVNDKIEDQIILDGSGFGDGGLRFMCHRCQLVITRDTLELSQFVKDFKKYLLNNHAMPGTILDKRTGLPQVGSWNEKHVHCFPRTFPSRLLAKHLAPSIVDMLDPSNLNVTDPPTMETIRTLIESSLKDPRVIQKVNDQVTLIRKGNSLPPECRLHTRKMMSRYWQNPSPFALDLSGAVHRQGIFTEKMYKIDWIHSPAARETMQRLVIKYGRFMQMMAEYQAETLVPTLDVDLAWHTHQLSPRAYTAFTVGKTERLIDHDDKMASETLSTAFEWTSKTYQATYHEVYSECTCWYCEAIRDSHISSVKKLLGVSTHDKVNDSFHESCNSDCSPHEFGQAGPHISTHASVSMRNIDPTQWAVEERREMELVRRLDEHYRKAQKHARKKGREVPPRDQYEYYWGYPYWAATPYAFPVYYNPGVYGGGDPGSCPSGSGGQGACAAGTCGGGVGAGSCSGGLAQNVNGCAAIGGPACGTGSVGCGTGVGGMGHLSGMGGCGGAGGAGGCGGGGGC